MLTAQEKHLILNTKLAEIQNTLMLVSTFADFTFHGGRYQQGHKKFYI
jgi:hypothetical protein